MNENIKPTVHSNSLRCIHLSNVGNEEKQRLLQFKNKTFVTCSVSLYQFKYYKLDKIGFRRLFTEFSRVCLTQDWKIYSPEQRRNAKKMMKIALIRDEKKDILSSQ